MPSSQIDSELVDRLFGDAPQLYVAIVDGQRTHVTPELLVASQGRLWCLAAVVTRKVEIIGGDGRVGFCASTSFGDVVGVGQGAVLDPLSPSDLTDPIGVARSAVATARFVARNAAELTGAVADALVGRLGRPLPPHRVVLSIEPTALAAVHNGDLQTWGDWTHAPQPADVGAVRGEEIDDELAPENLRDLLADGPAALGWTTRDGDPLALPATWEKSTSAVRVSAELFAACGAGDRAPAAVTRDKWTGFGPSGKQGVMLRGEGRATTNGASVDVHVDIDRVTYWDGVQTHSTQPE